MIALREYQVEIKAAIRAAIRAGKKRILVQCPTGGGKTVTVADMMAAIDGAGKHGIFLLPRRELVYQSQEKLIRFHVYPGIIMAGMKMDFSKKCQLASFDTLHARAMRTNKIPLPPAEYVFVDEAHLSIADTRRAIIEAFGEDVIVIGVTATPARTDGKCLGDLYDELILSWPTQRMVDEGYLVDSRYFAPTIPDLKGVKINKETGDFQQKALGRAMTKPKLIGDIIQNWLRIAPTRRTVVFCVTKSHARFVCEEFIKHGIKAEYVDDETPLAERKQIFDNLLRGRTQVLVNVFVATFGLDIPPISCVVIARPTRSLVLYHQMGGRGLRPVYAEGMPLETIDNRLLAIACSIKEDCIIIDHSGVVHRHGKLTDPVPWALTYDGTISQRKEKEQQEKKAPKEITCDNCKTVFTGSHFCPNCGTQMVAPGKPVPVHQANLQEVTTSKKEGKRANWETPIEVKKEFYAQAIGYAQEKRFNPQFAANKYRDKFGVNPPVEVYQVPPAPPQRRDLIHGWLAHEGMKRKYTR